MRVFTYKTKLTEDRKVVLEKEVSMNRPNDVAGLSYEETKFAMKKYRQLKRNMNGRR